MKRTQEKVAILSCCLALVACSNTTSSDTMTEKDVHNLNQATTDSRFASGRIAKATEYDIEHVHYDQNDYNEFVKKRCLVLGKALAKLNSPNEAVRDLARQDIERMREDDLVVLRAAAKFDRPAAGLVVPRRVHRELSKDISKQDLNWLAQQGRLLQSAYRFESLSRSDWNTSVEEMLKEGEEGKTFLAAQMIKRLANGNPRVVDRASQVIRSKIPDESVELLVAATYTDIPVNAGTFPSRTAEVLAELGDRSVKPIIQQWYQEDGVTLAPTDDNNWKTRRYFAEALGEIGGEVAGEHLILDLKTLNFDTSEQDDTQFAYLAYLIQAIGRSRHEAAVKPLCDLWRKDKDDTFLVASIQNALNLITGRLWRSPDKDPRSAR